MGRKSETVTHSYRNRSQITIISDSCFFAVLYHTFLQHMVDINRSQRKTVINYYRPEIVQPQMKYSGEYTRR
jgi:hypothetical protein